mgnify:CR=1 FL=1
MPEAKDLRKILIAKIHIAKVQLGFDDVVYRDFLQAQAAKESCSQMSLAELEKVLDAFKKRGFKEKRKRKKYDDLGKRPGMATPGQLRKIEVLWAEVTFARNPERALRRFVFKMTGVQDLRWLTGKQANQVIEVLKKIRSRGK